ncbi:hypothetical protein ACFQDE_17120 [Deinococcus caeni]|uniref:hypothetical protein n=1 Tax=Deinococcus caeni TaxID=569127 RepID=UPI00361854F7
MTPSRYLFSSLFGYSTLSCGPTAELGAVHILLKRRSADLRRGLIRLLASDPAQAQASAHTLLGGNTDQRQAALQLLIETGGTLPADFRPKTVTEQTLLARLTDPGSQLSLRDGLGLFDPTRLTRPAPCTPARGTTRRTCNAARPCCAAWTP